MQVFDGRHELIIAIKGKSVRKIQLNKWNNDKNAGL